MNKSVRKPRKTRGRQVVENDEFAAFAARVLRALGRRVASGDVEAIRAMVELSEDLDTAIAVGVAGLRDVGYSWAEIGDRLGISRQAAHKRWHR